MADVSTATASLARGQLLPATRYAATGGPPSVTVTACSPVLVTKASPSTMLEIVTQVVGALLDESAMDPPEHHGDQAAIAKAATRAARLERAPVSEVTPFTGTI